MVLRFTPLETQKNAVCVSKLANKKMVNDFLVWLHGCELPFQSCYKTLAFFVKLV